MPCSTLLPYQNALTDPHMRVLLHSTPPPSTAPPHLPRPHSKQAEPITREICVVLVLFLNCLNQLLKSSSPSLSSFTPFRLFPMQFLTQQSQSNMFLLSSAHSHYVPIASLLSS